MTVTLQLANQVRRLGRENLTVPQIASRLALPEMAIMLDAATAGGAIGSDPELAAVGSVDWTKNR